MKNYLIWMLLIGLSIFMACDEEEADFTGGFENQGMEGTWNVTSLWMRDCGTFQIQPTIDSNFFRKEITIDSVIYEIEENPELGTMDTFPVDTLELTMDSIIYQTNVVVDIEPVFEDEFDPLTGTLIRRLVVDYIEIFNEDIGLDSSNFELVISYDTIRNEDLVRNYETCESSWEFDSDGTGAYFVSDRDGGSFRSEFSWNEMGSNEIEICMSDDDCKTYIFTNSGTGGASLVDNNFNQKECDRAEWSLRRGNDITGEYTWKQIMLTNCDNDSTYFYDSLNCETPLDDLTSLIGSTCIELVIDCQNQGVVRVTGGSLEGDQPISVSELENGDYDVDFLPQASGQTGANLSARLTFDSDGNASMVIPGITLLNAIECPEYEIVFTK